jgi:PIN domain nuclease of toxin-antitoxin system
LIAGVADTHTALWYLLKSPRLSNAARKFIDRAAGTGQGISVSPISLAEIVYLVEKKRLALSAYEDLKNALATAEYVLEEAPLHAGVVDAMRAVPREEIPDLPDRVVAATAIFLRVPVISRDGRIRSSRVETIW